MADPASPAEALLRRWMDTGNHALLTDELDWRVSPGYPVPRRHWHGRAEVEAVFFPTLRRTFPVWRLRPAGFAALADGRLLASGHYEAEDRWGRRGEVPFLHLWTVGAERILAVDAVADFAAFHDAGTAPPGDQ